MKRIENTSLATVAKEYALKFPERVEDYVLKNLNEKMEKTVNRLSGINIDFVVRILIEQMNESELEKLGEYLIEKLRIWKFEDYYYFEFSEGLIPDGFPVGPIFNV